MDNNTRSVMSKQKAKQILTEMFPSPRYTVMLTTSEHIGYLPVSTVTALVAEGIAPDWEYLHYETANEEHGVFENGGWSTVVNRIRAQVESISCGE